MGYREGLRRAWPRGGFSGTGGMLRLTVRGVEPKASPPSTITCTSKVWLVLERKLEANLQADGCATTGFKRLDGRGGQHDAGLTQDAEFNGGFTDAGCAVVGDEIFKFEPAAIGAQSFFERGDPVARRSGILGGGGRKYRKTSSRLNSARGANFDMGDNPTLTVDTRSILTRYAQMTSVPSRAVDGVPTLVRRLVQGIKRWSDDPLKRRHPERRQLLGDRAGKRSKEAQAERQANGKPMPGRNPQPAFGLFRRRGE